jgi:Transglutaminase-like superfamily
MTLLLFRAYLLLLWFETAIARGHFNTVYRRVRDCRVRPSSASSGSSDARAAINTACVLYFKQVECLQRSAALVCLLRQLGTPAQLVIGAQQLPFRAHAWVEVNGAVVNDSPPSVQLYGVLDRL